MFESRRLSFYSVPSVFLPRSHAYSLMEAQNSNNDDKTVGPNNNKPLIYHEVQWMDQTHLTANSLRNKPVICAQ